MGIFNWIFGKKPNKPAAPKVEVEKELSTTSTRAPQSLNKLSRQTGNKANDELQFALMIGRMVRSDLPGAPVLEPQFRELSFLETIDGQCVACSKPAKVVTCQLDSIERLVSTLATKGYNKLPPASSALAGSCKRCKKVYHLNCVKAITMGGGTVFLCGSCRSELTVVSK